MKTTTTFSFYDAVNDWVKTKWPQLRVGPEYRNDEPWVQISAFEGEWTVIDLFPHMFYHRVKPITKWTETKLVAEPSAEDIWKEEHLDIADPLYFEKLAPFVESSLIHTVESVRTRGGPK